MVLNAIRQALHNTRSDFQRIDDNRAIANAAVQRLAGINTPEAQQWIGSLQENPGRALQSARAFGGIDQVTGAMQAAQAQAQARAEADRVMRAANISDLERLGYRHEGTAGFKRVREAQAVGRGDGKRQVVQGADGFKYYADNGQRVLPGVRKPSDRRDVKNDAMGRPRFVDSGELVFPNAQMPAESRWDGKRIDGLRKERRRDLGNVNEQVNQYERYRKLDLSNPVNDFALVQIYGKMLDPSSVVREGEAAFIGESGATTTGQLALRMERMINAGGALPDEAREYLSSAIENVMEGNAANFVHSFDGWRSFNDRNSFSDTEENESLPYMEHYDYMQEVLDDRKQSADPSREEWESVARMLSESEGVPISEIPDEMVNDMLEAVRSGAL